MNHVRRSMTNVLFVSIFSHYNGGIKNEPGRLATTSSFNRRVAAEEVLRRLPFRVLTIQTDNGAEFQSRLHWRVEAHHSRHVYIRPRTPRLNGPVERSHRIDDQEFYQLLDKKE